MNSEKRDPWYQKKTLDVLNRLREEFNLINKEIQLIVLNLILQTVHTTPEIKFNQSKSDWRLRLAFFIHLVPRVFRLGFFLYLTKNGILYGNETTIPYWKFNGILCILSWVGMVILTTLA